MSVDFSREHDAITEMASKASSSSNSQVGQGGKKKNEREKTEDLISMLKTNPVASKKMKEKTAKATSSSAPSDNNNKNKALKEETERLNCIRKYNMYVTDPVINPILQRLAYRGQALPPEASLAQARAYYMTVVNILNQSQSKPLVRKGFSRLNAITEKVLTSFDFNVSSPVSLSAEFDKNIDAFEPELSELAIEHSGLFGKGGFYMRLAIKYMDLLVAIRDKNEGAVDSFQRSIPLPVPPISAMGPIQQPPNPKASDSKMPPKPSLFAPVKP